MTPKERATMQQALSTDEAFAALELILKDGAEHGSWPLNKNCEDGLVALAALQEVLEHPHTPYCKQAPMCKTPCGNSDCLEQPVNQEPISYLCPSFVDNFATGRYETCDCKDYGAFPVYTAPQPVSQEPVSLNKFAEWFVRQMPAGTVVGDPGWWAVRIYNNFIKNAAPQPVSQEPVAWLWVSKHGSERLEWEPVEDVSKWKSVPLYTAPQPVKEVELTDDALLTSLPLR